MYSISLYHISSILTHTFSLIILTSLRQKFVSLLSTASYHHCGQEAEATWLSQHKLDHMFTIFITLLKMPALLVISIEMSSKVSPIIWHWNEVLWMQNTWKYISRAHIYINGMHFNIRQRTAVLYFLAKQLLNILLDLRRECISK